MELLLVPLFVAVFCAACLGVDRWTEIKRERFIRNEKEGKNGFSE